MSIQEIIDAATPVPEPTQFQRLLEKARNRPLETVEVVLTIGDDDHHLVITEVRGWEFLDLTSRAFPREGHKDDLLVGYDQHKVTMSYPVDRITVDGENPTEEQWHALLELLTVPDMEEIAVAIWGIHIYQPQARHAQLKAMVKEATPNG